MDIEVRRGGQPERDPADILLTRPKCARFVISVARRSPVFISVLSCKNTAPSPTDASIYSVTPNAMSPISHPAYLTSHLAESGLLLCVRALVDAPCSVACVSLCPVFFRTPRHEMKSIIHSGLRRNYSVHIQYRNGISMTGRIVHQDATTEMRLREWFSCL